MWKHAGAFFVEKGYEKFEMDDFAQGGMQVINSLCENLRINVYRDSNCYSQDYVRGIAQHDVNCYEMEHPSGTEVILKPDSLIFGDIRFSVEFSPFCISIR